MKRIILISFLFINSYTFAQVNTFQTWLDYDHHYKKNGNWQFFSDYGLRWKSSEEDRNWVRLHARPSIGYKPSSTFNYLGGIGLFYTVNLSSPDQFEFRPWQGVNISWPSIKRFRFFNYFRLEERFSYRIDFSRSFVLKFRYKLGLNIPINNTVITTGTYYIPVSIELFFDLTNENREQTNDRTRAELGFAYRWSEKTDLKIIYTLQSIYNNQNAGVDFSKSIRQTDHILRITLSQKFGFQ